MGLQKVALARGTGELTLGTAARMAIGPQVAPLQPATMVTVAVRTKVHGRVDLTGTSVRRGHGVRPRERRLFGLLGVGARGLAGRGWFFWDLELTAEFGYTTRRAYCIECLTIGLLDPREGRGPYTTPETLDKETGGRRMRSTDRLYGPAPVRQMHPQQSRTASLFSPHPSRKRRCHQVATVNQPEGVRRWLHLPPGWQRPAGLVCRARHPLAACLLSPIVAGGGAPSYTA
jgi:hypothetical protein